MKKATRPKKKQVKKGTKTKRKDIDYTYYYLFRAASVIVFVIMVIVGGILVYALANNLGFDFSGKITAAATAVKNITTP